MHEAEMTSMETRQLHSSQKEAMKKIAEFSGEPNEMDIDEWLFDLTNLFSLMKLKDDTRILETMGKLTGPALRWYQENVRSFSNWEEAEKALRDRFKEFTSVSQIMQELFHLQQQEHESVTSFYEKVIRKYRKAQRSITEQQVITVLQTGVKNSLKEHLIRNEADIKKPEDWLRWAREEEYIQKRIQQQCNGSYSEATKQPFFESMLSTATIQPRPPPAQPAGQYGLTSHQSNLRQQQEPQEFLNNRTYRNQNNSRNDTRTRGNYSEKTQQMTPCLICQRKNHLTNQCLYKKENGCYKCGQSSHRIRDCPEQHFFE